MCTLSYLPIAGGYIMTTNRDEAPSRATFNLSQFETASGLKVLFPKDPVSGGTWIATNSKGRLACLLNGGKKAHKRADYYIRSRGLVLLDLIRSIDIGHFFNTYPLTQIEPFTLVIREENQLFEWIWDGEEKSLIKLDPNSACLWASSMLYQEKTIELKRTWFSNWQRNTVNQDQQSIMNFHQFGGQKDLENGMLIDRSGFVKTVSITSIAKAKMSVKLIHRDFISDTLQERNLQLS